MIFLNADKNGVYVINSTLVFGERKQFLWRRKEVKFPVPRGWVFFRRKIPKLEYAMQIVISCLYDLFLRNLFLLC